MGKWYRKWIHRQFIKSFDEYGILAKEHKIKMFIAKNFPKLHVSRNPRRKKNSWVGIGGSD